jgi:hypothetical protein
MATKTPMQRRNLFVEHAPILLLIALVWFVLTLWHQPISLRYIFGWTIVGILFSAVTIFGGRNRSSLVRDIAPIVVLIGGGDLVSALVSGAPSGWFGASQSMAIVFVCFCSLNWALRPRLTAA